MLPPIQWRAEPLILLALAWILCGAVGGLVNSLLIGEEWNWMRFLVGTLSFHGAALVLVGAWLRSEGTGWRLAFGFGRGKQLRVIWVATVSALMALPLAWLLSWASAELMRAFLVEPAPQQSVVALMETQAGWQLALMGLMAVGVVPVAEEVMFRGVLYALLKQHMQPVWAVVGSSVLFGLIHLNAMTLAPLVFLALVLVWLYEVTGNLLAPIVAHAVFNLANLLLLLAV